MKIDTAGNQIYNIISYCRCGLTGGCESCRYREKPIVVQILRPTRLPYICRFLPKWIQESIILRVDARKLRKKGRNIIVVDRFSKYKDLFMWGRRKPINSSE